MSDPRPHSARRRLPALCAALLAILALAPLEGCGSAPPPEHVVILVIVDTLRHDALACNGGERPTPHLDALAADGVRFDQAIAASGWTLPSVASTLTGVWPSQHKALGKGTRLTPISEDVRTAAEVLSDADFRTIGFTNATFLSDLLGLDRGFDIFDHQFATNFQIRRADETIEEALGDIADHGGRSTFALVHVFDPHLNYDPLPAYQGRYAEQGRKPPLPLSFQKCLNLQRRNKTLPPREEDVQYVRDVYAEEVAFVDDQIGVLVSELKSLGLYDRATIVLTSDHGEEFWEHRGFEHGHTLYDELVRVPLIVKPPAGAGAAGLEVDAQVRLIDVMPTVFELTGVAQPELFIGASLLPLMRGESEAAPRVAFSEATLYKDDLLALRSDPYKFVRPRNPGPDERGELYDWRADPGETRNLIDELPEEAARMRAELDAFYRDLTERSKAFRVGILQDLSPKRIAKEIERLKELGYVGDELGHQRKLRNDGKDDEPE